MTAETNLKHAVFQTSRHGDASAMVQIVGAFGTLGIVVPAPGNAERMTERETLEALRGALSALEQAHERLGEHIAKLDPEGAAAKARAAAEKPKERIPLNARFA